MTRLPPPSSRPHRRRRPRRGGQVVIFLLMALTLLVFVFFWNVDLHRIVAAKSLAQNAGDAAALAAARWQGNTLNLIGELNLMHALALSAGDGAAVDAITNIQARLCFTGPMTALAAAQVAAKNNRIYVDAGFTRLLRDHADRAARYDTPVGGGTYLPEPYEGAWREYAAMLRAIADDGVAAAPDNARFFRDPPGGHILLDPAFYEAVEGRNWCWFFLHHATSHSPPRTILDDYTGRGWWPPLPAPDPPRYTESEIFGLGLMPVSVPLRSVATQEHLEDGAAQQKIPFEDFVATNAMPPVETWYLYGRSLWSSWEIMHPDGPDRFPIVGEVKPEYDYVGADAVVRLSAAAERLSPAGTAGGAARRDDILWTAAAKPFGHIEREESAGLRLRPDAYGIVLPAFREVRLIPVDAATGPAGGAFNLEWRRHIEEHLPSYLSAGLLEAGCRYCDDLRTWENAAFRRKGSEWLSRHSHLCTLPSGGGGGGRGGGTRRGH